MNNCKNIFIIAILFCLGCGRGEQAQEQKRKSENPYVLVLGIAQDAGYPQIHCKKSCCSKGWENPQQVSCIALIDPITHQRWMFDCTPGFALQLHWLDSLAPAKDQTVLDGIFLTHAHIGHYTGLMHLGREAMNAKKVWVYTMPRMYDFLQHNGPWSQLVMMENVSLKKIKADTVLRLNERISIIPIQVPHRDEFSETVGYRIITGKKSLVFIPDIDKWEKWNKNLKDALHENDYLLIDGTFYADGEIPGRNMNEIPHPFISETMELLKDESIKSKNKIHFIHLNHTNPALQYDSHAQKSILKKGFKLARPLQLIEL